MSEQDKKQLENNFPKIARGLPLMLHRFSRIGYTILNY